MAQVQAVSLLLLSAVAADCYYVDLLRLPAVLPVVMKHLKSKKQATATVDKLLAFSVKIDNLEHAEY